MDPTLAKMLDLQFFHDNGWTRKICTTCREPFWTQDEARALCGDSTCEEYQFLGDPLTDSPMDIGDMREAFLAYWEGKLDTRPDGLVQHTRVGRQKVVARWRDDIYLNIASIANYQPHVTSGDVPPPANPLVVSQPCIRLNDLSNIGRSGRHFACFEMMGHHAFNSSEWGKHYWTEECVAWGHAFLTDVLGLDGSRITYKESIWHGGGNAGPCVEVFAGGLEVATLVFMCLEECEADEEGADYEIEGDHYRMMDLKIIDTGWGLERLAWASTGTPTAYDTVFPETIAKVRDLATVPIADDDRSARLVEMHARVQGVLNLDIGTRLDGLRKEVVRRMADHDIDTTVKELEEVMAPIEAMYGLCDHLRCLSFMVGDGVVPGNVKAGYLMRLVFRRAFRYMQDLGIEEPLEELLAWNMQQMLGEFPEFEAAIPRAKEIARLEHERWLQNRERGLRLVKRTLEKKKGLTTDDLVEMYDTHGLGPTTVAAEAKKLGVEVEVPDTFDAIVAERHSKEKKQKQKGLVPRDVPPTVRIFYEEGGQDQAEFDATVTWISSDFDVARGLGMVVSKGPDPSGGTQQLLNGSYEGKHIALGDGQFLMVTLDQSCFFHETGGQPGDNGIIIDRNGNEYRVFETKKKGEHPVHFIVTNQAQLAVGDAVHGVVDWELRMHHTRSHTATHIMNQSVRRVLGEHSWQAGVQKYRDCARVDMSHYRRPTAQELQEIEALANKVVMQGRLVSRTWHKREDAEREHGMQLLQGGIPKGRDVRVVAVNGVPEPSSATQRSLDDERAPIKELYDIEYCGGTHCHSTHDVGPIKLWRTERVQDGVERFEYSAGGFAVAKWQDVDTIAREAAAKIDVAPAELPQATKRFFDEWKQQRKQIESLQKQVADLAAGGGAKDYEEVAGVKVYVNHQLPAGALQETAAKLIQEPKTVALLGSAENGKARILLGRSSDIDIDMREIWASPGLLAAIGQGGGGGPPDFVRGAGNNADGLAEALDVARRRVAEELQ